jgi:hypothetical protein
MVKHHQKRTSFPCAHTATEAGTQKLTAIKRSVTKRYLVAKVAAKVATFLEKRNENVTNAIGEVTLLVIVHTMQMRHL